ncbi:MAG: M15 family metallopeptidase [Acidimicrobiia bacterium]
MSTPPACIPLLRAAVATALLLASCSMPETLPALEAGPAPGGPPLTTSTTTTTTAPPATSSTSTTIADPGYPLGEVVLTGPGPWETPPALRERAITAADRLPPPTGDRFAASITTVSAEVAARSTWRPGCPVTLEEVRYLTVSFWGFDGAAHTGELIVHETVADDVVQVFARLFEARFPIEEMRVIAAEELDLPPTGDGNVTTGFVCRPVVGTTSTWSQHAYGLAVDVNPFQNPYRKGEVTLPELAGSYLDRDWVRPGMIFEGDAVTAAFAEIGWTWGGTWRTLTDLHHFSSNGR